MTLPAFSRRSLLGGLAALGLATPPAPVARADDRPNIVIILTDDMRATDWFQLAEARTHIAGKLNTTFYENHVVATSLCAPSRISVLTGQYTHNHKSWGIGPKDGGWPLYRKRKLSGQSISTTLQKSGYYTAHAGKFLNYYNEKKGKPSGWNQWAATLHNPFSYTKFRFNVNGKVRGAGKNAYVDQETGKYAVRFITQAPAAKPLFLHVGFKASHGPLGKVPKPYRDIPTEPLDVTAATTEAADGENTDKPAWVRKWYRKKGVGIGRLETLEFKRQQSVAVVNDQIIAIVDALEAQDRLANTYFFITSDNGWMEGDHGLLKKVAPYDKSVRIPLLAAGAEFGGGGANRLVSNVDIAPTIAGLTGVTLPRVNGRDILSSSPRDEVLIENRTGVKFDAIRTNRYLYVRILSGERELYDYDTDPLELENQLADWLGHVPTADPDLVADLDARLDALKALGPGEIG